MDRRRLCDKPKKANAEKPKELALFQPTTGQRIFSCNKSYTTINEYARNVRQPSLEDLYTIAEILNVEVKDLLIERKK